MLQRIGLALLALLLLAPPSVAADDPVALVRELYRVHGEQEKTKKKAWQAPHRERFFARKLAEAIARAEKKGGFEFDFIYDGQDYEITGLEVVSVQSKDNAATVEARFKNFGEPQRIAYELVREGGAWRIADIRSRGKNGWVLTKLLAKR